MMNAKDIDYGLTYNEAWNSYRYLVNSFELGYEVNPYETGTDSHTAWSDGWNAIRSNSKYDPNRKKLN